MDYVAMLEERIQNDMVGALYCTDLVEKIGEGIKAPSEDEAWDNLTKNLSDVTREKADKIGELAMAFGNEREETGFRLGFHTAMRLCVEGLKGGVC